jgi:hypothetical protein
MPQLHPGQDTVLSWPSGATDCRVVAAAGTFVLLKPARSGALLEGIAGACTLTFLDGMIPMGWDGSVEFGSQAGELRFRLAETETASDRRSAVRLPIFADVTVTADDGTQCSAQMLDVSATGMRFRGAGRIPKETVVRLRVQLPGGPLTDATGVVRLSEPGGVVAVEYTGFHAASADEIGAWTVAQLRRSLTAHG